MQLLLFLAPPVALIGLAYWAYSRGANSAKENVAATNDTTDSELSDSVMEALGWPYWFGKGAPSTPWSDGPNGVDCSGFVQMALVRLWLLSAKAGDRGAATLADESDPIAVGDQKPGDIAFYPGHVMLVAGYPGADGHSPVMGASGGRSYTLGNDENAKVKYFDSGLYRDDFVTYMRLKA